MNNTFKVGDKITVNTSNIEESIRGVIEEIQEANGVDSYLQNGGFVEWRPADWTKLVTFMQARIIGLGKSLLIDLEALLQGATGGKQESYRLCAA